MADLTFNAGMKLIIAKNYEAVYAQSIAVLQQDEKNSLAFFFLGVVASDTGSPQKALQFFAKACEHEPRKVHYQTYLAKTLVGLGHNAQAKTHADIAASIGTKDALIADMIGVVYSRTGHHELAIPFFEQAAKLNPRWAKFNFNLGASAEFIGDFKKAKTAYTKTISADSKFYQAWFALIALDKQSPENNRLEELIALFESAHMDAEARLLLGHSIAKTLEDLGRHEESFDWLEKAKCNQAQHDRQASAQVFTAAKTIKATPHQAQPAQAAPIFIVGLPRTGTTLLDRILSSHKDVISAGELHLFAALMRHKAGIGASAAVDANTLLAARSLDMAEIGCAYLDNTKDIAQGSNHMVDKTPLNFLYAGLIHRALPNARIIALRRGAMDSCLSNYRQLFAAHNRDYDYSFNLEDTAHFYREFDTLMAHWRETLPADRFTEIRYEDIVHDQENQTRRLLEFCDLNWDEACMNFHENTAPVATASAVQVRKPLYSGSIGRWKKYGDKLDGLKAVLGDLAEN